MLDRIPGINERLKSCSTEIDYTNWRFIYFVVGARDNDTIHHVAIFIWHALVSYNVIKGYKKIATISSR